MSFDARVAFLNGLIDDAGLFPPASLSMQAAVAAHRESRTGANRWILAKFICPASRLPELEGWLPRQDSAGLWRLGVILDRVTGNEWLDRAAADLSAARDFSAQVGGRASVDGLEVLLPPRIEDRLVRKFLAASEVAGFFDPVTAFLEIPRGAPLPETLEVIAEAGNEWREGRECCSLGAKLRCGGASEELFPEPARVAAFIHSCTRLSVPFKATAGLHHPFRHRDAATGFIQHGFVNLVGAAVLAAAHNLGPTELEQVISDEDPTSFSLTAEGFSWRDLSATDSQILEARQSVLTSYGSCSFSEPVQDLTALGILPL